ncbi:MAG: GT4 family glycosyltransferase PelF [Psychromonas sp.]|nr:GT4 family glycosyltransferase PelF [Psychromonas sp.]
MTKPKYIRKSEQVDIMLIGEGTYPFIRGGVSSWIYQLIIGLNNFTFGLVFIGSQSKNYSEILYDLPENLVHIECHYLFDQVNLNPKKRKGCPYAMQVIDDLHESFQQGTSNKKINYDAIFEGNFLQESMPYEDFMFGELSWEFIKKKYYQNANTVPFQEYFWSIRNMHQPIWLLDNILKKLPIMKVVHSPSTGYAGYLSATISQVYNVPFLLTEHGIYTRERKIDMMTAKWLEIDRPAIFSRPDQDDYLKNLWVGFFQKIGEISYCKASKVLSLFNAARDIQITLGAPAYKSEVIANGIDIDFYGKLIEKRADKIPPIIGLIGRIVSIKDIHTFIRAIRVATTKLPEVQGWLIGPLDEDEKYVLECKSMVKVLKLENNIKFLGFQNIHEILPQLGLTTLTSISEGMPLVILESFAAGIPCIATDVGSCRELIQGGIDDEDVKFGCAGKVFSIANANEIGKSYVQYLTDKKLWASAQAAGLARVKKYYNKTLFLAKYRQLYVDAINKKESL